MRGLSRSKFAVRERVRDVGCGENVSEMEKVSPKRHQHKHDSTEWPLRCRKIGLKIVTYAISPWVNIPEHLAPMRHNVKNKKESEEGPGMSVEVREHNKEHSRSAAVGQHIEDRSKFRGWGVQESDGQIKGVSQLRKVTGFWDSKVRRSEEHTTTRGKSDHRRKMKSEKNEDVLCLK